MAALHAGRVDEDLEQRPRQRQQVDLLAGELDREIGLRLPGFVALIEVRAQRLADQQQEGAQDPVAIEVVDLLQGGDDLADAPLHRGLAVARRGRVEEGLEQPDQELRDRGYIARVSAM